MVLFAQKKNEIDKLVIGIVETVSGIPIYMYAIPVDAYEKTGKAFSFGNSLKLVVDENTPVTAKVENVVKKAIERKDAGKIKDFDALAIRIVQEKVLGIKYIGANSNNAYIERVKDIPVFIYAKPVDAYDVIAQLPANISKKAKRGLLHDKLKYMIKQNSEKLEKGEIKSYDALIFNPNDLSQTLIKFKN